MVTEGRKIQDLSISAIMLQHKQDQDPGEVSNFQLVMESHKYYKQKHLRVGLPLKEGLIEGRDFITVPKGIWKYFKQRYSGLELHRHSVVLNRAG
jgi:hypothetical protein